MKTSLDVPTDGASENQMSVTVNVTAYIPARMNKAAVCMFLVF